MLRFAEFKYKINSRIYKRVYNISSRLFHVTNFFNYVTIETYVINVKINQTNHNY